MFWKDYVGEDTPKAVARRRGSDCIQSGLLAQSAGALVLTVISNPSVPAFWLGAMMIVAGVPLLVVGCVRRARSKGWSERLGGFLGLFGFAGVLLLMLLPDRRRERYGFQVVMPLTVSTTWLPPDEDPKHMPRSWGEEHLRETRPS